jgi:hypothetical protein
MRRLVASFAFASLLFAAPAARAGDDVPPLERAARLEAEAKRLLEKGENVDAARMMAESWRIRADVWAGGGGNVNGNNRAERVRRAIQEAEDAARALRAAGKEEDAKARVEEAARLRKKAEALAGERTAAGEGMVLREKVRDLARRSEEHARKAKDLDAQGMERAAAEHRREAEALRRMAEDVKAKTTGPRPTGGGGGLERRLDELRRKVAEHVAQEKICEAVGRPDEARKARAAAEEAEHAAAEVRAELEHARADRAAPAGRGPDGGDLAAQVRELRAAVREMRAQLEELRKTLAAPR